MPTRTLAQFLCTAQKCLKKKLFDLVVAIFTIPRTMNFPSAMQNIAIEITDGAESHHLLALASMNFL